MLNKICDMYVFYVCKKSHVFSFFKISILTFEREAGPLFLSFVLPAPRMVPDLELEVINAHPMNDKIRAYPSRS